MFLCMLIATGWLSRFAGNTDAAAPGAAPPGVHPEPPWFPALRLRALLGS